MTTPAQREAVVLKLRYFFGDDPSRSQSLRRLAADEIIAAYEAVAWQPIETAPKNGTRFLIALRAKHNGEVFNGGVAFCLPDEKTPVLITESSWAFADTALYDHLGWRPLPSPPKGPSP